MNENAERASIASLLKRLDAKDATIDRLTGQHDAMRAACEAMLECCEGGGDVPASTVAAWRVFLRAAIAKAKGASDARARAENQRDKQRARGICGCYRHEEIACAIASAREEGDAAGFERGRRAGLEEACRAACRGCAEALPLRVVELKNVGALLYHDGNGFTETCGAAPIRALIGGAP